jgi:hypothetical protein
MHLRLTALALLAAFMQCVPSDGLCDVRVPPRPNLAGLAQTSGHFELQFVPEFTHLSPDSVAFIKEMRELSRLAVEFQILGAFLHTEREQSDSPSPSTERDGARMRALAFQVVSLSYVRLLPLQPRGEVRSWNDGRVRVLWIAYCKRGITQEQCDQMFPALHRKDVPQ